MVFRPAEIPYEEVLRLFWEGHDPTQGMRQGNDVGTQYRSGIYTSSEAQAEAARASRDTLRRAPRVGAGYGEITTEIEPAGAVLLRRGLPPAVPREEPERVRIDARSACGDIAARRAIQSAVVYHQQYLAKNPNGYCGIGGTGVSCPVGVAGV